MRNMQGQKFISRVNFETSKHHRQVLRQQIKPELFQKLQVSDNPAANYINAYRNVYKDELQKTLQQHYNKKVKDEYQNINDKMTYSMNPAGQSRIQNQSMDNYSGMRQQEEPIQQKYQYEQSLMHSSSHPQLGQRGQVSPTMGDMKNSSGLGPMQGNRFRDYFEERTNKFEDHIKNNYDGGQSFFKVQDAYYEKKAKETQNYADILKRQMQEKEWAKTNQKQKQNMEHMAFQQMQNYQTYLDRQKFMQENEKKNFQNIIQSNEVEQERERRHRKSKQFQYNNISLHNPITNPIEYHIDNPYILKKIQDRTLG